MLKSDEIERYRKKYDKEMHALEKASKHMLEKCVQYKSSSTVVRIVFSRDPIVKTWESLINKIEDARKEGNLNYGYDNVTDIIALTMLCPYESDVLVCDEWLRRAFTLKNLEEDPLRETELGHRARHYIVSIRDEELQGGLPHYFKSIKCEIQVKTILEEAFDAKGHDLTYKSGNRDVPPEMKKQFAIFGRSLRAVDEHSEFLKHLIMEEEQEIELRREACIRLYLRELRETEARALAKKLAIDVDQPMKDISEIARKLKLAATEGISLELCNFAALCALESNDDYLKEEAISNSNMLTETYAADARVCLAVSTIKWAFGRFEEAITDAQQVISQSLESRDEIGLRDGKNAFVYFVADWKSFKKKEDQEWSRLAADYVKELSKEDGRYVKDTLGFYWIVFGKDPKEVERGRRLLKAAHSEFDEYRYFDKYHEYIALKKLLRFLAK